MFCNQTEEHKATNQQTNTQTMQQANKHAIKHINNVYGCKMSPAARHSELLQLNRMEVKQCLGMGFQLLSFLHLGMGFCMIRNTFRFKCTLLSHFRFVVRFRFQISDLKSDLFSDLDADSQTLLADI